MKKEDAISKLQSASGINAGAEGSEAVFSADLFGYAAQAASKVLLQNWESALSDGCTHNLVADIDKVIDAMRQFKAAAQATLPLQNGGNGTPQERPVEQPDACKMKVSLDGGETFVNVLDGVRVIYEGMMIPGEDGCGELHVNLTHEGIITDVWATREYPLDHNIGTSSEMTDDIICRLVEENE